MSQNERRLSIRKPLERLAYISLPFNNGGIVLDVSEGGLAFHAIAPVEVDGPIHFRFAVDSSRRIKAVGELAWKDETGKTGGLRFTELPDEMREYIREWSGQAKANVLDVPVAEPAIDAEVAPSSEAALAPIVDLPMPDPAVDAETALGDGIDLAPIADLPDAEPAAAEEAADAEAAPMDNIGWTPSWEIPEADPEAETEGASAEASSQPLLYNLRPPVYSAPSYDLSMFSPEAATKVRGALAAPREPFASRHPIAALVLTIFLASVIGSGIFAYVSTSQAGDVLYYLGEKAWEGFHPQPAPKSPATRANSTPDASKTTQR
ncbi:MAG: PilZ domain-containing protein [Acidobacteriia bacterium]|nr:PilZ domain-containing protein [Terriglobia bacterium]